MTALDWVLNNTYFQYYSLFIFLVSALTLIVVSRATPAPSPQALGGLTFSTVTPEQRLASRRSWNQWDVVNSAAVLALIAAAYLYFNG
jgi:SSS family solute:Na+ symporter